MNPITQDTALWTHEHHISQVSLCFISVRIPLEPAIIPKPHCMNMFPQRTSEGSSSEMTTRDSSSELNWLYRNFQRRLNQSDQWNLQTRRSSPPTPPHPTLQDRPAGLNGSKIARLLLTHVIMFLTFWINQTQLADSWVFPEVCL